MPLDPGADLPVLKFVLVLLLCVFLPLAGMAVAGTTVSLLYALAGLRDRAADCRRLAAALVRGSLLPGGAGLLLLLLAALILFLGLRLYRLPALPLGYAIIALLAAGLGLLYIYRHLAERRTVPAVLAGGAGLLVTVTAFFLLGSFEGLLVRPEAWPLLPELPRLYVSWPGTAHFLAFTLLSFATACILLPYLVGRDPADRRRVAGVGRSLLLAVLLLWPPIALFELSKLPGVARSIVVFSLAAVGILLAAILFFRLLSRTEPAPAGSVPVVLMALLFAAWILGGHFAREQAVSGPALAPAAAFGRPAAKPSAAPAPQKAETADGKAVFERICSTCHRLDSRLVGPPLQEVVPKYRDRPDDLRAFIRNPVKVNPDYSAMPKLGLSEAEIAAVADWLLKEVGQ